eukprot:1159386-Pelagomonas_calceolata.AAC.3
MDAREELLGTTKFLWPYSPMIILHVETHPKEAILPFRPAICARVHLFKKFELFEVEHPSTLPPLKRLNFMTLLLADFGAPPKTAPRQVAAGGHLGTQGTSWGPPACLGKVQLKD